MFSLSTISTIFWTVSIVSGLLLLYVFVVSIKEFFALRKIDKDSAGRGITHDGIKPTKDAESRKASNLRLGLSLKDAGLFLVNITLAFTALATFSYTVYMSGQIDRPFITLENSLLQYTDTAIESEQFNQLLFETYLVNTGKLPAKFDVSKLDLNGYEGVLPTPVGPMEGVIFPGQNIRLAWIFEWNSKSEEIIKWAREEMNSRYLCVVCGLDISVDYTLLEEEEMLYSSRLSSEKLRTPDGKLGRFNFSFFVHSAN